MALHAWWPWVYTLMGFPCTWLVGNKNRLGFLLSMIPNSLGIVYLIATDQYGFIPGNVIALALAARNYRRWKKKSLEGETCACGESRDLARW